MRKVFVIIAGLLLLSQLTYAGSGSAVFIADDLNAQAPAARMQVLADYVAVPITIDNEAKDPVKRIDEIEKAFRVITEKLASQQDLKIMPGVISLVPREPAEPTSFSYSETHRGSAQLYVLGALKQDTNIFAITKRIYQVVASMPQANGTKITLGNTALGLDEPEKYRNQMLGLIAKSVAEAKKALGTVAFVEVEGLEKPVTVMQLNDREVLLFINYRLRVQTKAT
jgi:hypothetical protein